MNTDNPYGYCGPENTDSHRFFTRREMLKRCGMGIGMIGLASLLQQEGLLATGGPLEDKAISPLRSKPTHFAPKANRVIWLFLNGGPSHIDTWDNKPELEKFHDTEFEGFDKFTGFFSKEVGAIMKSPFVFTPRGECGKMVSELFPYLGKHVDRMAFINSMYSESNNHTPALFMMNSGLPRSGFPCMGSWITYGLGSESQDLPGFVVMADPLGRGLPKGGRSSWSSGFLPGVYQGTLVRQKGDPILNLRKPGNLSGGQQRAQVELINQLNRFDMEQQAEDSGLSARIESFELAYRMQTAAPEAFDIESESSYIKDLYGLNDSKCAHFGRQCLMGRRLLERGTRFVQIYSGGNENQRGWDGHIDILGNHSQFAAETDRPIAALLTDLVQRGLLEDTLVIWGGEFGRLPVSQVGTLKPGRDHNPHAMVYWMAGGGVKGGVSYGETDELGYKATKDPVHINDFHATIFHLLGMDHERLTYKYNGRRMRLTDVAGEVIHDIIA
ncbi:MAG: hypothetical protein CMI18_00635 [Opitutaceae bacterium]|nr:hypothetical protein [Opitutaceae bacterium]